MCAVAAKSGTKKNPVRRALTPVYLLTFQVRAFETDTLLVSSLHGFSMLYLETIHKWLGACDSEANHFPFLLYSRNRRSDLGRANRSTCSDLKSKQKHMTLPQIPQNVVRKNAAGSRPPTIYLKNPAPIFYPFYIEKQEPSARTERSPRLWLITYPKEHSNG